MPNGTAFQYGFLTDFGSRPYLETYFPPIPIDSSIIFVFLWVYDTIRSLKHPKLLGPTCTIPATQKQILCNSPKSIQLSRKGI